MSRPPGPGVPGGRPRVGPHAPSLGRQLWGLPSRVEYLSPQGVLLPLVYGTTASSLWFELRGLSAWQATPSWTVYRLASQRSLPWLRVTFAMVPNAAWPGSDQQPRGPPPAAGPVDRLGRPSAAVLSCPSATLGVHVCAVSWATWLLFTGLPARCVSLLVRCPGPLGSCSPVCQLGALCCVCGVLGHLAPVQPVCPLGVLPVCAVSWDTWLLFTGVPAWCFILLVRCRGPPGSCSPVCTLRALLWVCSVLGHLAPVHRCARSVCCVVFAVSCAIWFLFTGAPARCAMLRVRCPGPLGSCSPVCPLGPLLCVCGVLGHLAPDHRCARSLCCLCARCPGPLGSCSPLCPLGVLPVCAVSCDTWLLFTDVPAWCIVPLVRCRGPLGSCSPVCPLGALFFMCGVLGHLAPVHRCARSVRCFGCAVSWATWLLFTGVPARCAVLRLRCPAPFGSCSPVRPRGVPCCVCGVLGHLAPVRRSARSVRCFACAVSWATWLLITGVPARCAVCVRAVLGHLAPVHRCARSVCCLCVRCRATLGSCSPVCPLGALFCLCGVVGHLALVHRCVRLVRCFSCAVSWATWPLFTGVHARCVALRVQCPGLLGSCSPVCPLGVLCCVCAFLRHLVPVHRCARAVCCVACAVSWATWLLFAGVPARCVVLLVRCPGPYGSCSPVCPLGVLCCVCCVPGHLTPDHQCARSVCCLCVRCPGPLGCCSPVCPLDVFLFFLCGVLGDLAPVHRCPRSVCGFACAVSMAIWLLFTGVPARCAVLRVWCPGPLGSCSPVRLLCALLCFCGVLGHLAPVHRCARSVRCLACAVLWATWLLFTGVPAQCAVCVCGVLGHLAPVHRCARSVRCFACAVSWATWLLFTGMPARCFVLHVRCPGPLGSCSPVCPLGVLCCVCSVLGHLAPVHRCARLVRCFSCAMSWATWPLFTGVHAWCAALRVGCPRPLGS